MSWIELSLRPFPMDYSFYTACLFQDVKNCKLKISLGVSLSCVNCKTKRFVVSKELLFCDMMGYEHSFNFFLFFSVLPLTKLTINFHKNWNAFWNQTIYKCATVVLSHPFYWLKKWFIKVWTPEMSKFMGVNRNANHLEDNGIGMLEQKWMLNA